MKHKTSVPRFILRRTTQARQLLGGQFEFLRASAPDQPLVAVSFKSFRGGLEVEMLEPIAELKPIRQTSQVGGLVRLFYKLPKSDVVFEGL
jgi:hypothetical protein